MITTSESTSSPNNGIDSAVTSDMPQCLRVGERSVAWFEECISITTPTPRLDMTCDVSFNDRTGCWASGIQRVSDLFTPEGFISDEVLKKRNFFVLKIDGLKVLVSRRMRKMRHQELINLNGFLATEELPAGFLARWIRFKIVEHFEYGLIDTYLFTGLVNYLARFGYLTGTVYHDPNTLIMVGKVLPWIFLEPTTNCRICDGGVFRIVEVHKNYFLTLGDVLPAEHTYSTFVKPCDLENSGRMGKIVFWFKQHDYNYTKEYRQLSERYDRIGFTLYFHGVQQEHIHLHLSSKCTYWTIGTFGLFNSLEVCIVRLAIDVTRNYHTNGEWRTRHPFDVPCTPIQVRRGVSDDIWWIYMYLILLMGYGVCMPMRDNRLASDGYIFYHAKTFIQRKEFRFVFDALLKHDMEKIPISSWIHRKFCEYYIIPYNAIPWGWVIV